MAAVGAGGFHHGHRQRPPAGRCDRIAYRELVLWMEAEHGFDRWDAHMMLSQCRKVRLDNFVDPKYIL
jgi:amidase